MCKRVCVGKGCVGCVVCASRGGVVCVCMCVVCVEEVCTPCFCVCVVFVCVK